MRHLTRVFRWWSTFVMDTWTLAARWGLVIAWCMFSVTATADIARSLDTLPNYGNFFQVINNVIIFGWLIVCIPAGAVLINLVAKDYLVRSRVPEESNKEEDWPLAVSADEARPYTILAGMLELVERGYFQPLSPTVGRSVTVHDLTRAVSYVYAVHVTTGMVRSLLESAGVPVSGTGHVLLMDLQDLISQFDPDRLPVKVHSAP